MDWVRLYHEMPTDPKWRFISRKAGQRIGDVVAIYAYLLCDASRNLQKRGVTQCDARKRHYEIAAAFDMEVDAVTAIIMAMEGVVLKSGKLTGWEKRNPIREDSSTERVQRWRNAQKRNVTHGNAREDKSREEKKEESDRPSLVDRPRETARTPKRRASLPDNFPDEEVQRRAQSFWTSKQRLDLAHSVRDEAEQFRDHHLKHGSTMADWPAAWRTWCRNALKFNRMERPSGRHESPHKQTARIAAELIAEFEAGNADRDTHSHDRPGVMVLLERPGGRPAEGDAQADVRRPDGED